MLGPIVASLLPSAWAASTISDAELASMVDEIAPVVEDVAGRRFVKLPEVVMADPRALEDVVYQEQVHLLSDVEGMPEEQIQESARRTAAQVAGAFAGKYGFLDGRLYVSIDGIRYTLGERRAPDHLLRPMVRVVIAHELAHALQDQHTDLDFLVRHAHGSDAVMAINCAVEGHAVWVHEEVGSRMGLTEAVDLMADLLGYDEPIRRRMDPEDFYNSYVYGLGRDFVAFHAALGGTEQVWRVLSEPPERTSAIVSPERWGEHGLDVDAQVQRTLARASRRLADREWRAQDARMGDFDVRDQLIRSGGNADLADSLLGGWNARTVGGPMQGVEVQLLRFDGADGALAFVEDMMAQAQAQASNVGMDPFIRAEATTFDDVRADASAREAIRVRLFGEVGDDLGRIWVARGPDVVQVVTVNSSATDRSIARSIEKVFRSIP